MTERHSPRPHFQPAAVATALVGTLLVLWSYWPTLGEVVARWWDDPQYSHGFLVPPFAAGLLWLRRGQLNGRTLTMSAWGLPLLLVGVALRLAGAYFHFGYFDQISLLPCLAGLTLLAGGWPALQWAWPAVAFLAFMVPLPYSVAQGLSGPLRGFATVVSTFLLQAMGRPALAEGNVILLNEIELGIVDACSGLSMLVTFFALSTAVAVLVQKPIWEKLCIALSAVPIALAANVLRITATGLVFDLVGNNFGGHAFHDVAGWLMMPLGLAFLGLELWILNQLVLDATPQGPLASRVSLQRVDSGPVSLYAGRPSSRRERRAAKPAAEPVAEPTPEPVSQQS